MSFSARKGRGLGRAVRPITAVLLQLSAALATEGVRADGAESPGAAPPRVVWLELRAEADESKTLRATLAELCSRLNLVLRDGPSSGDTALAELSIDLSRSAPIGVVVRSGHNGRVVLQRPLPVDSSRPVVLESAATIAYTALETLLQEPADKRVTTALADAATSSVSEPTILATVPTPVRSRHFGLEMAPLFQLRTGDVPAATAWGGGLRVGGGWRSVFLEPSFALTGTIRQSTDASSGTVMSGAFDARTYSLRLSVSAALLSLRGIALQTGPSFAVETTTLSVPMAGMAGMGMPASISVSALRPGWEARLLVGPIPSVQAFLGANGDCALAAATPPAPPLPAGSPQPSPQNGRCGVAVELGFALTLFGAPAVHVR